MGHWTESEFGVHTEVQRQVSQCADLMVMMALIAASDALHEKWPTLSLWFTELIKELKQRCRDKYRTVGTAAWTSDH